MAAHASKIFKAVASDPDATKDTKDPVGDTEGNEDDRDKVEDCLSSKILAEDSVENHQVPEACYSHRDQSIPSHGVDRKDEAGARDGRGEREKG